MALVLHHSQARGTAKVVLLGIANHDGDGGAFPSQETLAKYANVAERNVRKAIDQLVELGEVEVIERGGLWGGLVSPRHQSNAYRVLVQCPADCDRTANHRCQGDRTDSSAHPDGDRTKTSAQVTGRNHPSDRTNSSEVTGRQHPTNRPYEPPKNRTDTARAARVAESFTEFWSTYPRKSGKIAAEKAWARAVKTVGVEHVDRLLGATAAFRDLVQRTGTDARFIPHPATWLNQGRWDDAELQPSPQPGTGHQSTGTAPWCGDCDERSRLIYPDGRESSLAAPCPTCHPFSVRRAAASS